MKILCVHSALSDNVNHQSQVDHWRIYRPMRELAKHVDWQIDHQPTYIPGIEKYKNLKEFTEAELEKAFKIICSYDIVFSSYHADHTAYTMLKVARDKAGTQFVLDFDDNIFAVNEDNPFWVKMTDEKAWLLQVMVRENDWVTTTTEELANQFRRRRAKKPDNHPADTVFVLPNGISDDYQHPEFDNSPNIVIGYFGGSSHYADLHETGIAEALERVMHEHKNVRFKAVGMPMDKYLPRARYEFQEGKRGTLWTDEVFPSLKMDIAIAPLDDNTFNLSKSDIKWQESTRAGAAVAASNVGPYAKLPKSAAALVENNQEAWYEALTKLVEDEKYRKILLRNAQKELDSRRLEVNWNRYREVFEKVHEQGRNRNLHLQQAKVSNTVPGKRL